MNILQRIFTNYYEEIKYTLHPRASEMENIEKMINCGDPSFGGAMYGCPHCGNLKFIPFRCLIFEGGYSYDGVFVTFHYNRHEDEKYVEETLPAMDFIKRLIRHIPEKHFKMIRYSRIYARHREIDKYLHGAIAKEKHLVFRSFNQWRTAVLLFFLPLGMTLYSVLIAGTKWSFLNSTTITSAFLSKNFTRM